ncbi:MAG: glycoside hydrolase family 30 protein, partial [Bacteroidaceae bacterium]|nr:glycoside hydrolase family 30 protein [Bacteroidaceae bacterium]
PVPYMRKIREQLRDVCNKYGIKFWQTEICIMSNDTEIGGGQGYDFTMKTALYVARVIHHDLTYADAESWSWWRACGGNYRDGLIRIYEREQSARDSKLLWAMGNYSRFVRPGAVRYEVTSQKEEDPFGLMVSAYKNQDGKWVCVAINYSDKPQDFQLNLSDKKKLRWQIYRTSDAESENLKPIGICKGKTQLSARSISTFVEK